AREGLIDGGRLRRRRAAARDERDHEQPMHGLDPTTPGNERTIRENLGEPMANATARLVELERAIAAAPDDGELRFLHAEVLQEAGDPRGELVALALATARGDRTAAAAQWRAERKANRSILAGVARLVVPRVTWQHGSVDHLELGMRGWLLPDNGNVSPPLDLRRLRR